MAEIRIIVDATGIKPQLIVVAVPEVTAPQN